ncbi:hypothetical protein LS482_01920 [Sinomicrobium kalidii]|uniref:hypothetical protein n=1 Tax=Sinomicrobium kalidii TaxID=2900738 RepID=UPI001E64B4AB|nr:hypothetical protein [Sinomicrobium kalidii]UGU16638.1 hypothetical protein LS482_01920 [Sinomicrobium kalidii]
MKKILALLLVTPLIFISCEGDQGPPGPPGEDGLDGGQGRIYEVSVDQFEYIEGDNIYSAIFDFSDVFSESHNVFVYHLLVIEDDQGNPVDSWDLLPYSVFTDQGTFQYSFNHTSFDLEILINGDYDLSNISTAYTQDQIFRVVVTNNTIEEVANINNMEEVMKTLKINNIEQLNIRKN